MLSMTVMVVRGVLFLRLAITCRPLHSQNIRSFNSLYAQIGASVAKYAGNNVFKRLAGEQNYKDGNYQEALKKAFLGTDEDILKSGVPELNRFLSLTGTSQTRNLLGTLLAAQLLPPLSPKIIESLS